MPFVDKDKLIVRKKNHLFIDRRLLFFLLLLFILPLIVVLSMKSGILDFRSRAAGENCTTLPNGLKICPHTGGGGSFMSEAMRQVVRDAVERAKSGQYGGGGGGGSSTKRCSGGQPTGTCMMREGTWHRCMDTDPKQAEGRWRPDPSCAKESDKGGSGGGSSFCDRLPDFWWCKKPSGANPTPKPTATGGSGGGSCDKETAICEFYNCQEKVVMCENSVRVIRSGCCGVQCGPESTVCGGSSAGGLATCGADRCNSKQSGQKRCVKYSDGYWYQKCGYSGGSDICDPGYYWGLYTKEACSP